MTLRIVVLVVITAILSTACKRSALRYRECDLLDTCVEIQLADPQHENSKQILDTLVGDIRYLDKIVHPTHSNGMRRINGLLRTGEWASINPSMLRLVQHSLQLFRKTGGLFNPALGDLVQLWGFDSADHDSRRQPPSKQAIAKVLAAQPRMTDIVLDGIRLRSSNPAVQLHFGVLLHGHAADIAENYLRSVNIASAKIMVGNTTRVIGKNGDRPWYATVVNIPSQRDKVDVALADGEAICSLRNTDRYFDYQGKRYHNILDPRSGYPADASRATVVIHDNAAQAAVACYALFIAGPRHWHDTARRMGIHYGLLVDSNNVVHLNPAMAQRWPPNDPDKNTVEYQISQPL